MRSSAMAPLVAIALAALFLGPSIAGDRTIYFGDLTAFEHPRDRLVAESFRAGEGIPRWTPDIFGGVSAIGAQELALLYPPNTLLAIVAPGRARAIGVFLHLVLAALGARALARRLGVSEEGALLAAIVYGSGGALLSMHSVAVYVRSAGWLPWILTGASRRSVALTTLALLGMYLGGDPMGCVLAAVAALALGGDALTVAKAAPLALLLGAAQLLPALGALGDTSRGKGFDYDTAMRWSLWPPELLGLVVPFLFGSHASPDSLWVYAVKPDHERAWCETLYVGPIALALAGAGVARPGRARRVGLALLVFVLLALGRFTPLGHLLYLEPSFRYPAKLVFPAMLGLALLAGHGLDALPRKALLVGLGALGAVLLVATNLVTAGVLEIDMSAIRHQEGAEAKALAALAPRLAHAAFFALGAVAVLARARRKRTALVLLVLLDLAFALRPAILTAPRALLDAPPPAASALRAIEEEEGIPARVLPSSKARSWTESELVFALENGCIPGVVAKGLEPDGGLGEGARSQIGFLSNEPLRPLQLELRVTRLVQVKKITHERAAALRGARFLLVAKEELEPGAPALELGERALLRVRGAPPWAGCYPGVRSVPDVQGALSALGADDVPVVEGALALAGEPRPGVVKPARLVAPFRANRVELEAEGPGWLVLREAFAKGWEATVDGERTPVYPADVTFRAVPLSPGTKKVVLEFHAPWATAGVLLSVLGALGCLGVRLRARLRARGRA